MFDSLSIPFLVGGSMASSSYGEMRTTNDIDIVADIRADQVTPLVDLLAPDFYADTEVITDAVIRRDAFNLLDLSTFFKVDVFLLKDAGWAREEMARRRDVDFPLGETSLRVPVATPEDIVLQKLAWYRLGGGISERQWRDIQGIFGVQTSSLDLAYMRRWAGELGVADLLEEAVTQAGL